MIAVLLSVLLTIIDLFMLMEDSYEKLIYKYRYKLPLWFVSSENATFIMYLCALLPLTNLGMLAFYMYDRYMYIRERLSVTLTDKTTYCTGDKGDINIHARYSDDSYKYMRVYTEDGALLVYIDFDYEDLTTNRKYVYEIVYSSLNVLFPGYRFMRANPKMYELMHADRSRCNINEIKNLLDSNELVSH